MAQAWANHLAATGVLAHNPGLAALEPAGWRMIAENVGMGANDPAIESSFAGSPEHYNNMVDARLSQVGVGVAAAAGSLWVVEDFWGGSGTAAPPPSPPPPPVTLAPHGRPPAPVPTGGYFGPVPAHAGPAAQPTKASGSTTAAAASAAGTAADLDAVARQIQYFQAWD